MEKTSLKQKLFLIILGVCLAAIFLEIGLRLAGGFVLYLQERHNHVSFAPNEYRILCLGESTTALGGEDSYPSQLEEMLNAQADTKKFTVINKGIISTNTGYILEHVEQNLDTYKPQIVVLMMGINDKFYLHGRDKTLWWENIKLYLKDSRVYKLAHLLYEHITHRIKGTNAPVQEADLSNGADGNDQVTEDFLKVIIGKCIERFSGHISKSAQYRQKGQISQALQEDKFAKRAAIEASSACVDLARRYRFHGLFQKAQSLLEEAAYLNGDDTDIYQELGELYLAQKKSAEAVNAFQKALTLDPKNSDALPGLARAYYQRHQTQAFFVYARYLQINPQDYWGYIELAQWLKENKNYDLAQSYLSRAIEIGPSFNQAYVDLGQTLDEQGQYQKEEAFYLKEISLYPQNPRLYQALGQFYQKQGKEDLAKKYFQKAAGRGVSEYSSATLVNYNLILNKILSRHIKVVVMQYPLRDISPLKDYLGQRNNVVFVENKQNFKQALAKEGYHHYFKDNFASDFGHCTRAGNELIARNLAEIVLKHM